MPRIDMTSLRYGRLVALRPAIEHNTRHWWFVCDCGKVFHAHAGCVRKGTMISCGCYRSDVLWKHRGTGTPLYRLWSRIKERVSPDNPDPYKRALYHGTGIRMHPAWVDDYAAFRDYILAELGPKPSRTHSIDRIDPHGHYEPGNLRWATPYEQTHNRRPRRKHLA